MWERNAADDTFGFGVVFSDETLGGIGNADERIAEAELADVRAFHKTFYRPDNAALIVVGNFDEAALNALAQILTGGKSSRLYKRLVFDRQVAQDVVDRLGPGGEQLVQLRQVRDRGAVADLDEAIIDTTYSAFGYQGQKCSAASRA